MTFHPVNFTKGHFSATVAAMRFLGYARLSRHTEESTSIERQREIIEREVAKRGGSLVGIEEDVDVSALRSGLERPALIRAREAIRAGRADALIVWRLDRLARSVGDFMTLVDGGIEVISATEPIDTTTPMGRAMAQVLQVFAELESRTTGLRVAASKAYLRRIGRFPGGRVPYGYRTVPHPDGAGYALAIDAEEAKVIRRAVGEILAGSSLHAATQGLNRDGVLNRAGKAWEANTLKRILLGNAVLGRVTVAGDVLRDSQGLPEAVWEPVVTPDEVARIRPRITRQAGAKRRKRATRMLSGLIYCKGCGGALNARTRHGNYREPVYGCRTGARGQVCEIGAHIKAATAEEAVERDFLGRFGRFKVTEIIESTPEVAGLAVVEEAIQDTLAAMGAEEADLPALVDRLTTLRAERERLKDLPQEVQSVAVELDETFRERWESLSVSEKRRILTQFGLHVRVGSARNRDERLSVEWRLT